MEKTVKAESKITMIPVCRISCGAAKGRGYSRKELSSLSRSIEKNGIIQPITVRDITPYSFELVSGERRLRAAVMAGLSKVPCIIIHCTRRQSAVYSLVDDLQREPQGLFERAEALRVLLDEFGFSREQAAVQLGVTQRKIGTYLALLELSEEERELIRGSSLTVGALGALLKVSDISERKRLIARAVKEGLTEDEIKRSVQSESQIKKLIVKDMRIFYNTIERTVATMRQSGINAQISRRDSDGEVEYRIVVAKK